MLLSTSQAFLFIAVPKTASSSIEHALGRYHDPSRAQAFGKHALAMELAEGLSGDEMAELFKFAFVRHPYTWMYSWYRFRQRPELQASTHRHHDRYAGDKSFEEFMQSFNEGQIFLKQSDFLCSHGGELLVDFVGRYESLREDFGRVCDRLRIAPPPLEQVNVSHDGGFSAEALSPGSRELIHHHFQRDFELFSYEMLS